MMFLLDVGEAVVFFYDTCEMTASKPEPTVLDYFVCMFLLLSLPSYFIHNRWIIVCLMIALVIGGSSFV
jgi:hypothetical protein